MPEQNTNIISYFHSCNNSALIFIKLPGFTKPFIGIAIRSKQALLIISTDVKMKKE